MTTMSISPARRAGVAGFVLPRTKGMPRSSAFERDHPRGDADQRDETAGARCADRSDPVRDRCAAAPPGRIACVGGERRATRKTANVHRRSAATSRPRAKSRRPFPARLLKTVLGKLAPCVRTLPSA